MFDYSLATVKPWPTPLPFASRHSFLTGVRWNVDRCTFEIEIALPGETVKHWCFSAERPIDVLIEQDERQTVSLWHRRDQCCKGAQGFLLIEDSPVLQAVLRTEPHLETDSDVIEAKHFVLGTDAGVAHVLCRDVPSLTEGAVQ